MDPILITDLNGNILEVNRQAVALSRHTSIELQTMRIDQIHEVNWEIVGTKFEALQNGATRIYESGLHRQDGGSVPVEVYARHVEFQDANSIQWILRDITARRELDELRNDMTSMIFHDLRSPLGNIVGNRR
ncbi:MAG: PAS domain S-box protein [Saprospirales bacterium]|nr:PAS domain S-box protein [Saprospirales bacterium]